MIRSMTGFGKGEASVKNKKIITEVRSLNSKQLDLSIKLPAAYRSMDSAIRGAASKVVQRGKTDIYITVEQLPGTGAGCVDEALFTDYYRQLSEIALRSAPSLSQEELSGMFMPHILRLPEVVKTSSDSVDPEEEKAVMGSLEKALECIDRFREQEGGVMMSDILSRVDSIRSSIADIEPFESGRVDIIKNRINESIEKLGVAVDSNRLEQEMIFYIEKLDITEEKVRLANHCDYFRQVVKEEDNPGRKLGFIAQEMGREINTLGSKANSSDIQRVVVGMKDELEKIKEQLLNIL